MQIVVNHNGKPCTTSRLIADRFGKQHNNVIRLIQTIEDEEFRRLNFEPSSYLNQQNRLMPEYIVTRDGFTLLVMGFTGKEALKFKLEFIKAFNDMEATLKPKSNLDLMEFAIREMREQEARVSKIEHDLSHLKATTQTRPDYFTVVGFAALMGKTVNLSQASAIGRQAAKLCEQQSIPLDTIPDPRFGRVNMYPKDILSKIM